LSRLPFLEQFGASSPPHEKELEIFALRCVVEIFFQLLYRRLILVNKQSFFCDSLFPASAQRCWPFPSFTVGSFFGRQNF